MIFPASGTFTFTAPPDDIVGSVVFSKTIFLPPLLPPTPVSHVLIGDWDVSWSLTKIGFRDGPGGTLIGFPPAFGFGPTGTFDVDIDMVSPPPGHSSLSQFISTESLEVLDVDTAIAMIPVIPETAALLGMITPGTGFVPFSFTSLHVSVPAAVWLGLPLLGVVGVVGRLRRLRRAA